MYLVFDSKVILNLLRNRCSILGSNSNYCLTFKHAFYLGTFAKEELFETFIHI